MQRLQAFKYELMPDGEQTRKMRRFAGSCRFVFNKALALQKENYEAGGKFVGYVAMAKLLTGWRNGAETPWLKDAPVHPLQNALKDLEKAYKNFFAKRAAFPRFKKKGQRDSFRYPDSQAKVYAATKHFVVWSPLCRAASKRMYEYSLECDVCARHAASRVTINPVICFGALWGLSTPAVGMECINIEKEHAITMHSDADLRGGKPPHFKAVASSSWC